jgi:ketosteroid isomerase-like protein
MRTRSLILATIALCGCALRHRPTQPEPARGPATDTLLRFDQSRSELAATRGGVEVMSSLLGPNVVYLRAGVPAVYGRPGVLELLSSTANVASPGIAWEPLGGGVSYDLASGYTYGVTARPSVTGSAVHLERYIAVWERRRGTEWRIEAYAEIAGPLAGEINLPPRSLTPPATIEPDSLREASEKVKAADSLFADLGDRMGAAFAFSNTIAPQGVLFGSPQLVIGADAARDYYTAHGAETSLTWRPVYAWVTGSKDLGFTVGEYIATGRGPSGAAVQHFGKYLTVWQRQPDGTWRFVVDGGNPSPPKSSDR